MTGHDVRDLFDRALENEPSSSTVDVDLALRVGRAARARRRWYAGAGLVAAVAAASVAAALVLPSATPTDIEAAASPAGIAVETPAPTEDPGAAGGTMLPVNVTLGDIESTLLKYVGDGFDITLASDWEVQTTTNVVGASSTGVFASSGESMLVTFAWAPEGTDIAVVPVCNESVCADAVSGSNRVTVSASEGVMSEANAASAATELLDIWRTYNFAPFAPSGEAIESPELAAS